MVAIPEKRHQNRLIMDDSFSIHHRGNMCRVVDISSTGIGVTYIGGENWPKKITLEYSLRTESSTAGLIECRTVWESSMDFYKARNDEKVRRRGLEFIKPGSRDVEELHSYLKRLAENRAQ